VSHAEEVRELDHRVDSGPFGADDDDEPRHRALTAEEELLPWHGDTGSIRSQVRVRSCTLPMPVSAPSPPPRAGCAEGRGRLHTTCALCTWEALQQFFRVLVGFVFVDLVGRLPAGRGALR